MLRWRRPTELAWEWMGEDYGPPLLIEGVGAPTDVKQGALGDCWLLSALATLAERPELLAATMPTRATNDAGAYQVRLCRDGAWEAILLDDALPCTADGVLAFARGARRQLWVSLIEKAFAKMYGCYEALEGGTTDEALAALTGFPCERISLQPPANNRSGGGGGGGVGGAAVASWGAEGEAFDSDPMPQP